MYVCMYVCKAYDETTEFNSVDETMKRKGGPTLLAMCSKE